MLPEIRCRFPDIEDLVVRTHGAWYWLPDGEATATRGTTLCNAFQDMKNLKRVRLPWPTDNSGGYLFHNVSPEELEKAVNSWIRGGAEKLEKVVFAIYDRLDPLDNMWESLVGFKILKDRRALEGEIWWKVEPVMGEMLDIYIQGVGQRPMDELFKVPPQNAPVNSYGKQNWFS